MGIRYNGTTQYITVADEPSFDWERTQPFSGCLWVYDTTGASGPVLSKASSETGTGIGWAFNMAFNFHLTASNVANNEIFKHGPDRFGLGGTFPFSWQHLAFTYDGSSTLAGCKLYTNGIAVNGDGTPADEDNLTATILVNQAVRSGFINPSEYVAAGVSNIMLFDQELTAGEMALLGNAENFYADPSALIGVVPKLWLPLSSNTDLDDASGNGHDATAVGSPTSMADPNVMLDRITGASGTTSFTWTHTPFVEPRGVVVCIQTHTSATDVITDVTYGGVPMARREFAFAADASGEPGAVWIYFLGSGVPTGDQTVSVTVASGTTPKRAVAITLNARGDVEVAASGNLENDVANPSITLPTNSAFSGYVIGYLYSGHDALASITVGTDYLGFGQNDLGAQTIQGQFGTKQGASVVCNFTATSEDAAMVAMAIESVEPTSYRISPPLLV